MAEEFQTSTSINIRKLKSGSFMGWISITEQLYAGLTSTRSLQWQALNEVDFEAEETFSVECESCFSLWQFDGWLRV